jgi:hypothetical protein
MELDLSEKFKSRCATCYKLAENEFLPLFCSQCHEDHRVEHGLTLPRGEPHAGNRRYQELDFYRPLANHLPPSFVLLLWLTYRNHEHRLATWQGVFAVSCAHHGESVYDKFDSYARSILPDYEGIHDVICCKVDKAVTM